MALTGLLVAASLVTAPIPDAKAMPHSGDYPASMLQAGKSAYGDVDLIISPDGKVESCTLIASAGDQKFASQFCGMFSKFPWHPALGSAGSPVYAELRISRKFFIPDTRQGREVQGMDSAADFEATFPDGIDNRGQAEDVYLAVEVGTDGKATTCVKRSLPASKTVRQELIDRACATALQRTFKPINTEAGAIQHFVKGLIVRFHA